MHSKLPSEKRINIKSYAKTNLFLDLIERRADNYTDVHFIMNELPLFDEMEIEFNNSNELELECNVKLPKENTITKTVELFRQRFNFNEGIKIKLDKRIPEAAGFGGGSSNCAALAKILARRMQLKLTNHELADLIKDISTDACFFLFGGIALVSGKGDNFFPLGERIRLNAVVFVPDIKIENKTKTMYSLVKLNSKQHADIRPMIKAIIERNYTEIARNMFNYFETVEFKKYEKVFSLLQELREQKEVLNAILCGAGPAIIALCEKEKDLIGLAKRFNEEAIIIADRKEKNTRG
ncbi:MAG: 4-(cytidine 5'-diphospho)-2-C-methyl-D-erythritol kinase [Candidatus Diapherotrites archaeon]|nr:4-(cytidine 5'-diphospho)-2-C-methyl-D-erythritol kinase [Candidatus Diapherotrites archaeon]